MQSFDFKKLLPHLYIIVGFAILSLLYCYPALEGKVLSQHDNVSWRAMYHEAKSYHDSTGINPLWTNNMFGGMPTYTIGIPESSNYVGHLQTVITSLLAKPAYFLFLAMVGFYILMSVMRIDRWLGVVGAVAYAFATYNIGIIAAGHETKMLAIAYMPAVLAGLIVIYRGRWLPGAALLGISLALMVSSNHFQVLYYAFIMILFYVIGKLIITIKEKRDIKNFLISSVIALVVAVIGMGPSMASILTTKEYAKTTMRGGESELTINHDPDKKAGGLDKDYAFMWSSGIGETFTILVPYLYGGSSSEPVEKAPETEAVVGGQAETLPMYWGPQPFIQSGPAYLGAVICFLFVLGMFVVRSGHKWWILAVSIVAFMLSWGDHFPAFNYWVFDNLPMYNKFRTPTMTVVIPQLLFPLLGMWGVMEIIRGKVAGDELWKKIRIAGAITAGLCLLIAFGGSMFFDFTNPQSDAQLPEQIMGALKEDRANMALKSALTSAVYVLIAVGLLWAFVKDKIGKNIMIGGLGLIIAIDLISVASNYLNENNYEEESDYEAVFQPRPVDQQILQDKDPYYRVLDASKNTYNDAIQAYFHKSIGGYSPAKMEIYQDLIDMQLGGAQSQGKFNAQVLNMLNTKYIIFEGPQKQAVYQPNPAACGNAWFVDEVKYVATADDEMKSMNAGPVGDTATHPGEFDPKRTAIIRQNFSKDLQGYVPGKDSAAVVRLTKYGLNDLYFESNNSRNGLAVFSDIWYPYGWEAYVDGKQTPIIRANYVLRAIKVPAGAHKIEFHFRPSSFKTGDTIAMITSILLILTLVAAVYFIVKGKRVEPKGKDVTTDPDYTTL
jgi:hypothetical protein